MGDTIRESRKEARDRVTGGHREETGTADEDNRAARKQERAAHSFRFNPEMERIREIKDKQPAEFSALSSGLKMQLGYYEKARAAAIAEGQDVTGG